jgi:hypothetical protein
MTTYIWAWTDGEGCYVNNADDLSEILHEVLEYYSSEYDYFTIETVDGEYWISIVTDGCLAEYKIDADPRDVAEFLEQQAALLDRPDRFNICII